MIERTITKEDVTRKLDQLLPETLAEVDQFIDFLRYRVKVVTIPISGFHEHPAFGLWADRSEIGDAAEYAQVLRRNIEERRDAKPTD